MNRLAKIARSAEPCTGVQFRRRAYGSNGIRRFLRDVIALANAAVEGSRYIVVGVDVSGGDKRRIYKVPRDDFAGKPSYQALVTDFVEPPIRLKYHPVTVDGKRVGVFEIGDCQDRPYMMRVDHSERLRRGDAYIRIESEPMKMGRRQLQDMFEQKFRDSVSADRIEIGFPGEIIHKDLRVKTINLANLPSAIASAKLKQLIEIQANSKNTGSTTVMARLTHARLFGTDDPYENRSPKQLMRELSQIKHRHANEDALFLFEKNASELQLVVYNQGDEPIEDASLSLVMPNHTEFYVARQLPKLKKNGAFVDRSAEELGDYPSVNLKDDAVLISNKLGDVPANSPVDAFHMPLRICVGSDLKGRKVGIRYSLFGRNLRRPAKGKLRLLF